MSENVYATPESVVDAPANALETYQPKMFKVTGQRISREQYTLFGFLLTLYVVLSFIPLGFMFLNMESNINEIVIIVGFLVVGIVSLVLTVYGLILVARRLHDLDKSGWFMLIFFIPFIGSLMTLYLVFAKGDEQVNRFGAIPEVTAGQQTAWKFLAVLITLGIIGNLIFTVMQLTGV